MELVIIVIIVLAVVFKLGLFGPVVDLTQVATRESQAYNREHKVKVAKRYENLAANIDAEKVNETITKIDELEFD